MYSFKKLPWIRILLTVMFLMVAFFHADYVKYLTNVSNSTMVNIIKSYFSFDWLSLVIILVILLTWTTSICRILLKVFKGLVAMKGTLAIKLLITLAALILAVK